MADPFEPLRIADAPLAPSRAFAADLRHRLEAALSLTPSTAADQGDTVPTNPISTDAVQPVQVTPAYQPVGYHSVTTYITVDDFAAARRFYEDVLDARLTHEPIVMDDGRVGHAEMTFGDTVIMISEAFPEIGVLSATSLGGSPFMLTYYVPDADAVWQRAVDAGAVPLRPVEMQFYGARSGQFSDPFGLRWSVTTQVPDA